MFYYNRQIIYLDLMRAGERIKSAGFLKLEEVGEEIRWQIRIQGLGETDNGFYDLRDEEGAAVDKILLKHGGGSYSRTFERTAVSRGGRPYAEICGLRLELTGGRRVEGNWRSAARPQGGSAVPVSVEKESQNEIGGHGHIRDKEEADGEKSKRMERVCPKRLDRSEKVSEIQEKTAKEAQRTVDDRLKAAQVESALEKGASEEGAQAEHMRQEGMQMERGRNDKEPVKEPQGGGQEKLYEDKWEQLQHLYQTVHPFGDEREYLSITPRDFVILGQEYQKMVHNSFLLHGYYNYRHVILGKVGKEGEESYYLGVPGVFYEREKMAAEMFGFEAFEGQSVPARPGSFGYYMKKVRL